MSLDLDAEDERALDEVWAGFRRNNPDYRASPEQVAHLKQLEVQRAELYARLPPREQREREAAETHHRTRLRLPLGLDPA